MQERWLEVMQPVHAESHRFEDRDSLLKGQTNAFREEYILQATQRHVLGDWQVSNVVWQSVSHGRTHSRALALATRT